MRDAAWKIVEYLAGDKLDSGFVLQRALFKLAGLYWWEKPSIIKRMYSLIIFSIQVLGFILVLSYAKNIQVRTVEDINKVINCLIVGVAFVCPIFKLIVLHSISHKFVPLIEHLENLPPDGNVWPGKSWMKVQVSSITLYDVGWAIRSLATTGFLFDCEFPWDETTVICHILGLILQTIMALYGSSIITLVDALLFATVEKLRPQIRKFKDMMSRIGPDFEENKLIIKEAVILHSAIQRGVSMINDCFWCLFMFQMLYFIPFICATAYLVTKMFDIYYIMFNSVPMVLLVLTQLYMFCGAGQLLATEMEDMDRVCYNNAWYVAPLTNRKDLIIMMECSRKNLTMNSLGIITANNATFLSVLQQGYSYFIILHTMVETITS